MGGGSTVPGLFSCHSVFWVRAGQLWFKLCRARCIVQWPPVSFEDYATLCGGLGQPSCTSTSTPKAGCGDVATGGELGELGDTWHRLRVQSPD